MRGAVCGSRGVCAVADYHAGSYAHADADRNAADRDGYSCASDPDDNADAHEDVGSADDSADANESAERNAYHNSPHADAHEDADDGTHGADTLGDRYACAYAHASRNAGWDVGDTEVNANDGGDQDSDGCRHVHAYEYPCGDQDPYESADT